MAAICGLCQHFTCDWPETWEPEDRLGECVALDPNTIPHAWRWCPRERTGVYANEESNCPRFDPKP